MLRTLLMLTCTIFLAACQGEAPPAETIEYDVHGEAFSDEGAVPVEAVAAEPEAFLGQPVKLEGTVAEVCQMKGCWLTLRAGDARLVRIHVPRAEDGSYVFTVPKDLSGQRVVVAGTLTEEDVSDATHQHYAEDAGTAPATDAAPTELQLTATGVLVEKATS